MDGLEDYNEVVPLIEEKILNLSTATDIQAIVLSIAAIIGICGNIYVIWLIFASKCCSNITNCYILNRSFADLFFLLTVPFIVTQTLFRSWPFGTFMCKASIATTHGCGLATCFLLAAISVHCYFTASGSWDSNARLFWFRVFLAIIWTSAAIYSIPHLVFFGVIEFRSPLKTETHCTMIHSLSAAVYLNIINALIIVVPIVNSSCMAISICLINTSRLGLSEVAAEAHSGKKLMIVLTIMNAIWQLPFVLASLLHHIHQSYDDDFIIALFLTMPFPFISSALNPFIYLRYKGDLLKPQQSETPQQEPTVAFLASEQDSLAVQCI